MEIQEIEEMIDSGSTALTEDDLMELTVPEAETIRDAEDTEEVQNKFTLNNIAEGLHMKEKTLLDMHHKAFLVLFLSLSHMKVVICVTSQPNQSVTETITLFRLTKPMESESNTETPCKGLYGEADANITLTNTSLDVFPECLPKNVEILDLSFNNLTVIREKEISELSMLRILNLKHNKIREIYLTNEVLNNLEELDLSYNLITKVPKCINLKKMKRLSLAGNTIFNIPSFAFNCFPNLEYLNLSSTWLRMNSLEDISESAFALSGVGAEQSRLSLYTLDISRTHLDSGYPLWSKDLPNLKELHIMKMNGMERLEEDLLKSFPHLEILNCAGSSGLSYIASEVFENASNLRSLDFQNCNLSSLSPWNVSSGNLTINLLGNPLNCSCELTWLFSHNVTLIRANETFCSNTSGEGPSLTLLQQSLQCDLNGKSNITSNQTGKATNTEIYYSSITTTTEASQNHLKATSKPTLSLQERDQNDFIPESITVFKTTAGDSDSTTPLSNKQLTDYVTVHSSTQVVNSVQNVTASNTVGTSTRKVRATTPTVTTNPTTAKVHHTTQFNQVTTNTKKDSASQEDIPIEYRYDYEDEDEPQAKTTVSNKAVACNYHPCTHLQTPCFDLQQLTQCYCPGLSGEDTTPDPPRLREVSEITDTSAQIHWCAPSSVLDKYQIVYHPEDSTNQAVIDNIYVTTRLYTLYNLLPYTTYHICVIAVNKEGSSDPTNDNLARTPCSKFTTRPSYIIIVSALSALGGLFLATIIVLSVCLYKKCKNNLVNQYDTHLVSYKNPAFDYQLTIPSYH
ncbi:leucine-rich repeat neuronal protein 4 [Discoglossus pictus]